MQRKFLRNWRKSILDKYKVMINPRAIRELDNIYEYTANEKLDPENAKGQVDRIFRIDELYKTVYVVTIQYQRRNL